MLSEALEMLILRMRNVLVPFLQNNTNTNIDEILAQNGSGCLFGDRISSISPPEFLVKPQIFFSFFFLKEKIFIQ